MKYYIRYAEIGLKGKQVHKFEQILQENIRKALISSNFTKGSFHIKFVQKRGILETEQELSEKEIHKINSILSKIPGISWYGATNTIKDVDLFNTDILELVNKVIKSILDHNIKHISLDIKRYAKTLPFTSQDLFIALANSLRKHGVIVDKSGTLLKLFVYADKLEYILAEQGIGGLPVGSTGNAIMLFSGGIDSPVATYLLAKRGLNVNLLHFYPGRTFNKNTTHSKIVKLAKHLKTFIPNLRLFVVSSSIFKNAVQDQNFNYKLALFRRFMISLAIQLGEKRFRHKDFAVATGDNIGQVASQTLSNMININSAICTKSNENAPSIILRPVLTFNKEEIIKLAQKIDTYNLSLEEYVDCCTLIAGNTTKTVSRLDKLIEYETIYNKESILNKAVNNIKEIDLC